MAPMTSPRRLTTVPQPSGQRAVAYLRVSAVMGRRGLVEVDVIRDIDVSGRHFNREGLNRVLAMARARQVDVVALYDLSRLGRNTGESLRVITELRAMGVSIASTVEQIDDTPEGQFMLGQFLGMAQLYSDQLGRRWSENARWRAEQGRYHGSRPPLGYLLVPGKGLEPDPVLGPRIVDVFTRYAAGARMADIVAAFNRARPPGEASSAHVLKRALRNPVYVGRVRLHGLEHAGVHEPLVDAALWGRVQQRLEQDRTVPPRRLAVAYSLTGLVVCDGCGYRLTMAAPGRARAARGDGPRAECNRHARFHDCPSAGVGRPAVADIEQAVLDLVRARAAALRLDPAVRASRAAGKARAAADVRRLTRDLEETRTARGRLAASSTRTRTGSPTVSSPRPRQPSWRRWGSPAPPPAPDRPGRPCSRPGGCSTTGR